MVYVIETVIRDGHALTVSTKPGFWLVALLWAVLLLALHGVEYFYHAWSSPAVGFDEWKEGALGEGAVGAYDLIARFIYAATYIAAPIVFVACFGGGVDRALEAFVRAYYDKLSHLVSEGEKDLNYETRTFLKLLPS